MKNLIYISLVFTILNISVWTSTSVANSVELILVNPQQTEIPSTVVSLPSQPIYEMLNLKDGSPLKIVTESGETLPLELTPDRNKIEVWTGLSPFESRGLSIQPANQWPIKENLIFAHHDSEKLTAIASNGLLTAIYENEVFSIILGSHSLPTALSKENQIFEHFSLHKSLHHDPSDVTPYQKEISPEGWIRVFRSDAPSSNVETERGLDGSVRIIVTHKFQHQEARSIQYQEIFELLPSQPIINYRSVFKNNGSETCYLGSRVNQFSSYIIGDFDAPMQVVRGNGKLVNEGRLGWFTPRWFSAVTKTGYSLGFTALKPDIPGSHYFDFHRAGIHADGDHRIVKFGQAGIHFGAADAEKWAIFPPGKTEEIGVGVHVFIPGQHVRKNMKRNWDQKAKGLSVSIPSPVSVYLNGEAIQGGDCLPISDTFSNSQNWLTKHTELNSDKDSQIISCSSGKGSIYRAIQADFDNNFCIRSKIESVSPDTILLIKVQEINSNIEYTLAEITEALDLNLNLKELLSWSGLKSFVLKFELSGKKSCYTCLSNTFVGEPEPDAPELISPKNGMSLTDIAEFYQWDEVKGCGEYDLEISNSPDFKNPTQHRVVITNPKPYYFPTDLQKKGTYYWRVRALQYNRFSTPGKWSNVRHFKLNNDHSIKAPIIEVSSESPLITMRGDDWSSRENVWNQLDEAIKPHFAFRTFSHEGDFYDYLERYKEANMKVLYESIVPYGHSGKTSSLADMEYAYQHYPNVIGSCLGENFYTYFTDEIAREYQKRHHILAAKYGRIFHWADLHKLGWNELAKRPEFKDGSFSPVIIPLLKDTEPYTAYVTQGHLAGWWLSGMANNTGTQADIWYWASVGFRKCGENDFGIRQGNYKHMPPVAYIQHWLLAMMQGGAVYANEWGKITTNGAPNEMWTRYFTPFFKGIIKHNMCPTREEFIESTKVVVKGDLPTDMPMVEKVGFTSPNYGPFEVLYKELYRASDPIKDFIPKNGRYGLLTILPDSVTDYSENGVQVVSLNDLQTPEQVHSIFDPFYPETYEGDALVLQIGDSLTIMNSNENLDVDQTYEIPFEEGGLIHSMKGDICVHKYIMGKHENDHQRFWLQANVSIVSPEKSSFSENGSIKEGTYETRDTVITFKCREKPIVKVDPESASVQTSWDENENSLKVIMSHELGAVSLNLNSPKQ